MKFAPLTDGDVIVTEVDDQRSHPSAINIDLRMLRYAQNFTVKQSPSPSRKKRRA